MANTDPSLVAQEMDIGNMYNGGGKPLEVLKEYPGRFELMHVKDKIKSAQGETVDFILDELAREEWGNGTAEK